MAVPALGRASSEAPRVGATGAARILNPGEAAETTLLDPVGMGGSGRGHAVRRRRPAPIGDGEPRSEDASVRLRPVGGGRLRASTVVAGSAAKAFRVARHTALSAAGGGLRRGGRCQGERFPTVAPRTRAPRRRSGRDPQRGAVVPDRERSVTCTFALWALVVSNHRPSPCEGDPGQAFYLRQ